MVMALIALAVLAGIGLVAFLVLKGKKAEPAARQEPRDVVAPAQDQPPPAAEKARPRDIPEATPAPVRPVEVPQPVAYEPPARPVTVEKAPEIVAPVKPTPSQLPVGPALIYVVDDSTVVRTKLQRLVAKAGYRVQSANDGVQALKLFEAGLPMLLITDIEMPEMDGTELIARLHGDARTRSVPVIAISGHEGIREQLRDYDNVVDAFKKPWDEPQLLARLAELVGPGQPVAA